MGKDVTILPTLPINGRLYKSPFFLPNQSELSTILCPDIAFGIALASIMWAVDWIQLGNMKWQDIITNALSIPNRDKTENPKNNNDK